MRSTTYRSTGADGRPQGRTSPNPPTTNTARERRVVALCAWLVVALATAGYGQSAGPGPTNATGATATVEVWFKLAEPDLGCPVFTGLPEWLELFGLCLIERDKGPRHVGPLVIRLGKNAPLPGLRPGQEIPRQYEGAIQIHEGVWTGRAGFENLSSANSLGLHPGPEWSPTPGRWHHLALILRPGERMSVGGMLTSPISIIVDGERRFVNSMAGGFANAQGDSRTMYPKQGWAYFYADGARATAEYLGRPVAKISGALVEVKSREFGYSRAPVQVVATMGSEGSFANVERAAEVAQLGAEGSSLETPKTAEQQLADMKQAAAERREARRSGWLVVGGVLVAVVAVLVFVVFVVLRMRRTD